MKRVVFMSAFLMLFAACSDCNDVERVAYMYLMATSEYDVDKAANYVTPETDSTALNMARELMKMVDPSYIAADSPVHIDILSIDTICDTMARVAYHKTSPIKDFVDTVELRQRDGVWLVHAPLY